MQNSMYRGLRHVNHHNRSQYLYIPPDQDQQPSAMPARGQTPMPDNIVLSPAWNPLSVDFSVETVTRSVENTGDNAVTANHPDQTLQHVFLNPVLAGKSVKAFITDENGQKKEAVISLHHSNGQSSIRTIHYHTSVKVDAKTVVPKHPSPTHDNSLVIILKGVHVGKYGRRLHHSRKENKVYIIIELVTVQDGQKDILTGEVVELTPEDLCIVDESSKQKKLNAKSMQDARQKYREQLKGCSSK